MKELKAYMSTASTVEEWNNLREKAKLQVSPELINQLDASGYIHEVLHK